MTRRLIPLVAVLLFVSACSVMPDFNRLADTMKDTTSNMTTNETTERVVAPLTDFGEAPELTNTIWLNTPNQQPLRLADLRGSVEELPIGPACVRVDALEHGCDSIPRLHGYLL